MPSFPHLPPQQQTKSSKKTLIKASCAAETSIQLLLSSELLSLLKARVLITELFSMTVITRSSEPGIGTSTWIFAKPSTTERGSCLCLLRLGSLVTSAVEVVAVDSNILDSAAAIGRNFNQLDVEFHESSIDLCSGRLKLTCGFGNE
ncbi:hypothetical protein L1987_24872 [Smallanthus sonchifolius]|uniref:Uncharacterized protein n=1 Tax=Smallanthus sonchifolius TaxID=185202 RepID=A0ACB9ILU5_9ASTR|nr:hypothetical protein L1987_24872 [Smallanthus sonchifolius]